MNVVVERLQDKKALEPTYPDAKFWICSSGATALARAIIITRHESVVLVVRARDEAAARSVLGATGVEGTHWQIRSGP